MEMLWFKIVLRFSFLKEARLTKVLKRDFYQLKHFQFLCLILFVTTILAKLDRKSFRITKLFTI